MTQSAEPLHSADDRRIYTIRATGIPQSQCRPTTQEWWKRTDPCQEGLATRKPGEWWAEMAEIIHCD